jgi:hypothetical protein
MLLEGCFRYSSTLKMEAICLSETFTHVPDYTASHPRRQYFSQSLSCEFESQHTGFYTVELPPSQGSSRPHDKKQNSCTQYTYGQTYLFPSVSNLTSFRLSEAICIGCSSVLTRSEAQVRFRCCLRNCLLFIFRSV